MFEKLKRVNIKKIYDLDNSKFKNRKDFTTNFDDILNDNSIDAVVISTIAQTHYILAKKALEKGKHVLVEKPITLNLNHAKVLKQLSNKNYLRKNAFKHFTNTCSRINRFKRVFTKAVTKAHRNNGCYICICCFCSLLKRR